LHYTQIVLTDSQAGFAASAVSKAAEEAANEQEKSQLSQLADFLFTVANNPLSFPVKEPKMARALKKRAARMNPAPPKKPNARKRAQLRAQGSQKRSRAQKRIEAAEWNATRAAMEAALERVKADKEQLAEVNEPKKRLVLPWSKKGVG
jgi:hypothetical protein